MTYVPSVGDAKPRTITLIPGDGIGPEISHAVEDVVSELGAPIEWERFPGVSGSTPRGEPVTEVPADVLASIRRNKVCFKGTLFTPLSEHNTSTQSLNVQLRKGKKREERGEDLRERERGSQRPFSTTEVFFNGKKIEKRNFNKRQLSTSMSTSATASTPPGCPPGLRGSTSSSSGKTPKVCHFLFRSILFLVSFPRNSLAQKKLAFLSLLSALLSGEYSGLEHEVVPDVVESLKVITLEKSKRTAEYAFGMAFLNNRKKVPPDFFLSSFLSPFFSCCDPLSLSLTFSSVFSLSRIWKTNINDKKIKKQVTAVHKANIMKMSDGLFLSEFRKVAAKYPSIKAEEMIVDNTSMQLASNPAQFDVLVRRSRRERERERGRKRGRERENGREEGRKVEGKTKAHFFPTSNVKKQKTPKTKKSGHPQPLRQSGLQHRRGTDGGTRGDARVQRR